MDCGELTLDEMKKGFKYEKDLNAYVCNYCGDNYREGQVYGFCGNFYGAERAAAIHVGREHGDNAVMLINLDSKYNQLTENQKDLLQMFNSGAKDSEIAKKHGVSPATIRRQKFNFREKAKQARLYLACFESVFDGQSQTSDAIVPIHEHARFTDDRYVTTESEQKKIIATSFSCLEPLKLKNFPAREKKKIVVLKKIAEKFEPRKKYTEKEVNEILKPIYDDHSMIRRFLIIYGFMERREGGFDYRLT